MKAKSAFTEIIQPLLIQYMIDHYGRSYDTLETVKNTWRRTYPVSDEIIQEIFVQIKTIERTHLGHSSRLESFQTLLTSVLADYLLKYVRRSDSYQDLSKEELAVIIKNGTDISKNRKLLIQKTLILNEEVSNQ
jgi:hypothetical protein